MPFRLRPLAPEDYRDAARIFFCAIHEGTRDVYSHAQRRAWAGETIDLPAWQQRIAALTGFVAEDGDGPVGFMTIDRAGYVDLAFVQPSAAGQGVGGLLLHAVEEWASAQGATCLTTEASLAARPFFARHGWSVLAEDEVKRRGVLLRRFRMEKRLR